MDPLNTLSVEDRASFHTLGFGATQPSPFHCVHHAFEHQASLHPDNIAVEDFEYKITYSELDRQSNCLATHLRTRDIGTDSRVCLLVERSIPMAVGILAILKAGAAYVPLDGSVVSSSSLDHVLRDSGASIVLALRKFSHRISDAPVICLDEIECRCDSQCTKPEDTTSSQSSCYLIYTSGTTGLPKGVDVTHGNVTNLVCLEPGNLGMAPGRRVSQLMNVAFDMAAWEILGSLSNGATLCLRGKTSKEWRAVMKTVDIMIATPSMLLQHDPADYPSIKTVAVAGEPTPQPVADSWGKVTQFFNCCGPTEITIVNTMYLHIPGLPTCIGKPTPNNSVYVLNELGNPVPIGEVGLMWAGGRGISRGYVNLPEKTREKYRYDPFVGDGSLMFNTGDLGRWRADGCLEHLGRIDDQVKIKGFRVELDGVAAALATHSSVQAAVALLIDDKLWGFVVPKIDDIESIKNVVSKIQPYYAVPSRILSLDCFPKTANGKTDKRALRQMASEEEEANVPLPVVPFEPVVDVKLPLPPPAYLISVNKAVEAALSSPSLKTEITESSSGIIKSEAASTQEEGYAWSGYEDDEIPNKTQGRILRNLRHQIFTLYRRLFSLVFITNMAIFIFILIQGANAQKIAQIVVANLFCAILMRQDYVINAFFNVFCAVPASWPLAIRRVCARVYHIGGLHSGCAISGVVWLILFAAQATKEMLNHHKITIPTLVVTYCILLLLIGIVVFAYPELRSKRHNTFEKMHRFLGWTATAAVWVQVVLLTNDYKDADISLARALRESAPFWLLVVMTGSIILPWLRLRKVPVRSEVLSSHAVRLYFDYVTPVPGSFTRISDNPFFEWHGFATVPEPGKPGYSLVVSKAGDWTTKQITNPPTHLWVRGVPTCGVLRIVPLFRRLVFVATGSGIGPCAPCILERRVPIRLLWTSPNVRQTFGDKLVDSILEACPDAVVYDTRVHGKPDMVKLTYRLVREFNAEAVCVISNQKLTRKVVYGMMSRGIPAFGAIWDS